MSLILMTIPMTPRPSFKSEIVTCCSPDRISVNALCDSKYRLKSERNVESVSSIGKPSSRGVVGNRSSKTNGGVENTEESVAFVMTATSLCGDVVSEWSKVESEGGKCPLLCCETSYHALEPGRSNALGMACSCAVVEAKDRTKESPGFEEAAPN